MTTQITERDKRLLMFLGIAIALVALIYFGIMPLAKKGQELTDEIGQQKMEKQEKEVKVAGLPTIKSREESVYERLETSRALYYDILRNVEIDRMITGMALENGVKVETLTITMPDMEKYGELVSYPSQLLGDSKEQTSFTGAYIASVRLSLEGNRMQLQNLLDKFIGTAPKIRVTEFTWQENKSATRGPYTLNMAAEIYMCQDIEEYIGTQLVKEETESK